MSYALFQGFAISSLILFILSVFLFFTLYLNIFFNAYEPMRKLLFSVMVLFVVLGTIFFFTDIIVYAVLDDSEDEAGWIAPPVIFILFWVVLVCSVFCPCRGSCLTYGEKIKTNMPSMSKTTQLRDTRFDFI